MKIGTKHKHLKCEEKKCQRYGESLEYSQSHKKFMCPDTLVAEGEIK